MRLWSHLRIGQRIGLGFAALILLMVALGIRGVEGVADTEAKTQALYDHPFTVTSNLG